MDDNDLKKLNAEEMEHIRQGLPFTPSVPPCPPPPPPGALPGHTSQAAAPPLPSHDLNYDQVLALREAGYEALRLLQSLQSLLPASDPSAPFSDAREISRRVELAIDALRALSLAPSLRAPRAQPKALLRKDLPGVLEMIRVLVVIAESTRPQHLSKRNEVRNGVPVTVHEIAWPAWQPDVLKALEASGMDIGILTIPTDPLGMV